VCLTLVDGHITIEFMATHFPDTEVGFLFCGVSVGF